MKKLVILLSSILVLTFIGFSYNGFGEASETLEVVTEHGDFETFESVSELDTTADVVIKAKFTGNSEVEDFYQSGILIDSAQKSEMKVIKSYKGSLNTNDEIAVYEPGFVKDGQLTTMEGYVPINDKGTYVLFLRDNKDGTYVGLGVYQGKYDVSNSKKEEPFEEYKITPQELKERDFMGDHPEHFNKLKEDVLKKYKD